MIDVTCKSLNPDIIATDGDAIRRKLFNGRNKVILDRDVKTELEKLPLLICILLMENMLCIMMTNIMLRG